MHGKFKSRHPRWDRPSTPTEVRFWKHVDKLGPNECWLWKAGRSSRGYGSFRCELSDGRKTRRTHRISWELTNGPIPKNLCVLHSCDVRLCVNPNHLFLGSEQDNTDDMMAKGRNFQRVHPETRAKGEMFRRSCLTEEKIIEVRRLRREEKFPYYKIGEMYGVTAQAIFHICKGTNWRHVNG